jgi:hypothetical protein
MSAIRRVSLIGYGEVGQVLGADLGARAVVPLEGKTRC